MGVVRWAIHSKANSKLTRQDRLEVRYRVFSGSEDVNRLESCQKLKAEVFVKEQGWQLPIEGDRCSTSLSDLRAIFVLAETPEGEPVGMMRGELCESQSIPHREWFQAHSAVLPGTIGYISSVCVLRRFRGVRSFGTDGALQNITAMMLASMKQALVPSGAELIVMCTATAALTVVSRKNGFRLIDPPFKAMRPVYELINLAWSPEKQLSAYLNQREKKILSSLSMDEVLNGLTF